MIYLKYEKCNPLALGYAGAIVSAACMLLLGILGNIGIYMNPVNTMMSVHMFFSLSVVGILTGMIEGAVITFVALYALIIVYDLLPDLKVGVSHQATA